MLPRSTTCSMSCVATCAFVRPRLAVADSAPPLAAVGFRPPHPTSAALGVSARRTLQYARLCFAVVHRDHGSYSRSIMFGPSVRGAPTMTSADFWPTIPPPLDASSPVGQQTRSPRVLRTHLHAYACRIYVVASRASTGLRRYGPPHPATPPLSASCSSGQRFAFGFLQIRSHPRHPCRSANSSPCRVSRGLSPPSKCALPGAPT
jgi:hypothetical protein